MTKTSVYLKIMIIGVIAGIIAIPTIHVTIESVIIGLSFIAVSLFIAIVAHK